MDTETIKSIFIYTVGISSMVYFAINGVWLGLIGHFLAGAGSILIALLAVAIMGNHIDWDFLE